MAIHKSALSVCQEALSELRQDASLKMEQLTGEIESAAGRKCRTLYEPARMQALLVREWNFCRRRVNVICLMNVRDGYVSSIPDDCMRVVAAFGMDGHKLDGWSVYEEHSIRSREPIFEIEYVVDSKNVDRWPPLVRRMFVKLLARELAIPITGRNADLKVADDLYREALRAAALVDARENKPDDEVWGANVYADAIRGHGKKWHRGRWR